MVPHYAWIGAIARIEVLRWCYEHSDVIEPHTGRSGIRVHLSIHLEVGSIDRRYRFTDVHQHPLRQVWISYQLAAGIGIHPLSIAIEPCEHDPCPSLEVLCSHVSLQVVAQFWIY